MFTSPRRLLAVLVAATTVITMGTTATAHAVQPAGLPPVGTTFDLDWEATDVPLETRFGLVTMDFEGEFTVGTEFNPADPMNSVRAPVTGFHGTGTLPGEHGGTITIEQSAVDTKSLLRQIRAFPPRFEQTMFIDFTMTIDSPDLTGRAGPLVLTTKNPAALSGKLGQFPPKGDLYTLQNSVDLVLPDTRDVPFASIAKFPVRIGGL